MNYGRRGVVRRQREINSKGLKIRNMVGITLAKALLIGLFALVIIGVCLGIGMFKGIIATTPELTAMDVTPSGYATTLYDCEGHEMIKLVAENSNRTYVTMDKIPDYMAYAFVAIEDQRFYEHNGVDFEGILRAARITIQNNFDLSQGASTITQQLIKNNVFEKWATGETTMEKIKRKLQEQYLALELEKTLSKNDILVLYMNTINLGHNTLGVQAASLRYFGKPVYQLNLSECATIAAITSNPSKYDPINHPDNNAIRRKIVLDNMLALDFITDEEYNEAMADDVYSRIQENNVQAADTTVYSYFVDEVIEQAAEDLTRVLLSQGYSESQASTRAFNLLYSGGLSIYTTMDPQIQALCDEIYSDESNFPDNTKWYLNYRLSIEHANGETQNFSTEMLRAYFREQNSNFNLLFNSQDAAYEAIQEYQEASDVLL